MAYNRLTNIEVLKSKIFDTLTISTIAERLGIDLQASGEQYRGLCPFHEESTPSFFINDIKRTWHCFGCKLGGDLIALVEQTRHIDFIETLYWLASEADIDITQYERPMSEAEKQEEEFRNGCETWLICDTTPGRVEHNTAKLFGVISRRSSPSLSSSFYFHDKDYLLNGAILPWRMPSGRLVGWRVREFDGYDKKVIGTPNDFPLGRITNETLFGIQVAREHIATNCGRLILVEGEFDSMALYTAGIKNVVAMGGSTLTEGQLKLVESLHVRELIALFDGDNGGRAAAKVFAEKHWNHEIFACVAVCPDGLDPEDVVKKFGDWAIQTTIDDARSALEYLLRLEWSRVGRTTLTEKLSFVKWIRDTYGARLRRTDESLVLSEVARWLEIPEIEVRDYVRSADGALCAVDSERILIGKACADRQFYIYLRGQLTRDDFFVLKHQRIWNLLADMLIDGQDFDIPTLTQRAKIHGIPNGYIESCLELPTINVEYHKSVIADLALRRSARDDAIAFRDRIGDLGESAFIFAVISRNRP